MTNNNEQTNEINAEINELKIKNESLIKYYEEKLSNKESEHQAEIKELNENSERILNQLKDLFEKEKSHFNILLEETKKKHKAAIEAQSAEYEQRLKEMEKDTENEIEQLQFENEELVAKFNTIQIDAEHQINVLTSTLQTDEKLINDYKENILNLTKEHNAAIQSKITSFNKERSELNSKIDSLINDNSEQLKKNEELKLIIVEKDNEINRYQASIDEIRAENEKEINLLLSKFDLYKQKQNEINNEFAIKKMDFVRETSLLKQQIDHLNSKLEEQSAYINESENIHNENINELKIQFEETFNEKINEMLNEKNNLIEKAKESEIQKKKYEDKISAMSNYYETLFEDEKNNHKMIISQFEAEVKALKEQIEKMNKKSHEPIKRVNELLELHSQFQKENSNLKITIQSQTKKIESLEKEIDELNKEKNELINSNAMLNSQIIHAASSNKVPNTNELHKRFKSFCNNQLSLEESSNLNDNSKSNSARKKPTNSKNVSFFNSLKKK